MAKALALGFLTAVPPVLLVLFLAPVPSALVTWAFPSLVMAFPVATVVVAVSRDGRLGRVAWPLAILFLMLEAGALGVVSLADSAVDGPGGLPASLTILLALVWLGPLFVTTISYAATFRELRINDDLLGRLDALRRASEQRSDER